MTRKLIAIGAVGALVLAALTPAASPPAAVEPVLTTKTWVHAGSGSWFDDGNWFPEGEPQAGDTAVLPFSDGVVYTVEISQADAACEVLQIGAGVTLLVKGQKLTLGDADVAPTTCTLNGTLRFEKDGDAKAELVVYDWVTFSTTGGGNILATYAGNQPCWGTISRAPDGDGIGVKILAGVHVTGQLKFLCSVVNDTDDAFGLFGVVDDDQVMLFGDSTIAAPNPPFEISTTTSAGSRSRFQAFGGEPDHPNRIAFHAVTFGSAAPNWEAYPYGAFEVASTGGSSYWDEVPFDITLNKSGLLDVHHDFVCNGKLTAYSEGAVKSIRVHEPYVATWRPASP